MHVDNPFDQECPRGVLYLSGLLRALQVVWLKEEFLLFLSHVCVDKGCVFCYRLRVSHLKLIRKWHIRSNLLLVRLKALLENLDDVRPRLLTNYVQPGNSFLNFFNILKMLLDTLSLRLFCLRCDSCSLETLTRVFWWLLLTFRVNKLRWWLH